MERCASLEVRRDGQAGAVEVASPSDSYTLWSPLSRSSATVEIGSRVIVDGTVRPGMLRLQSPGERARVTKRANAPVLGVRVPSVLVEHAAAAPDQLRRLRRGDPIPPILRPNAQVEALIRMLLSHPDLSGPHRQLFIDSLAGALLALLLSARDFTTHVRRPVHPGLSDAELDRCAAYADGHLADRLNLTAWTAAAGMPGGEFARRFQRRTGTAPYAWFMNRRIERAKEMLASRHTPTVEIALETGFCSQSHFTEAFRRRVGVSPGQWRTGL